MVCHWLIIPGVTEEQGLQRYKRSPEHASFQTELQWSAEDGSTGGGRAAHTCREQGDTRSGQEGLCHPRWQRALVQPCLARRGRAHPWDKQRGSFASYCEGSKIFLVQEVLHATDKDTKDALWNTHGSAKKHPSRLLGLATWCTTFCKNKDAYTSVLINAVFFT